MSGSPNAASSRTLARQASWMRKFEIRLNQKQQNHGNPERLVLW
jgi:hypothetical protein